MSAQGAGFGMQGWTIEVLKQYILWVKHFIPVLSQEAEELLSAYYQLRRQQAGRQTSRTTVRMLESLVRVSQGHARLMARNEVGASQCQLMPSQ